MPFSAEVYQGAAQGEAEYKFSSFLALNSAAKALVLLVPVSIVSPSSFLRDLRGSPSSVVYVGSMPRFVTHPAKPDWGVGEILSIEGNVATILFERAGRKTINLSYVKLQPAEGQAAHTLGGEIPQIANLDIHAIRKLCEQFYAEFGNSTAMHVISDLRKFKYLTNGTARNLLRLAHQSDNKHAQDLAQQITKLIYGRLIRQEELA